ncbi:hypothetical protein HYT23_00100 [Candidatus Pacearchaeota archaeon]|nr:hypothetical protein [Candidatus Pacearchaeota archaeon]
MGRFNVSLLSNLSVDELVKGLSFQAIDSKSKELFAKLLMSAEDGYAIGEKLDSDDPTYARMYRANYQDNIVSLVTSANLSKPLEKLAYDIAHFSYSEGFRYRASNPPSIERLKAALA